MSLLLFWLNIQYIVYIRKLDENSRLFLSDPEVYDYRDSHSSPQILISLIYNRLWNVGDSDVGRMSVATSVCGLVNETLQVNRGKNLEISI